MAGAAALQVDSVVKRYGERIALHGVSLRVEAGEVCGLLGPNGAGKTTLVSIVAGLRTPDGGRVHVDGIDVVAEGQRARCAVGLAAQETGLYPTLSVRENLELFTRLAGFGRSGMAARIDEVAEVVELVHLLDRQARHLSGGERRRLHTAMALVHRPKVLLLDEPTTGVDIATRSRLLDAIGRLAREEGCAIVYSTHYLPEVEELGASVAILDRGCILARGPLDELVATHGVGSVELTFDGPPPSLPLPPDAVVDGPVLRVPTDRPGVTVAGLLVALGPEADRLVSVELSRPSLETVFLSLTGRAYSSDVEDVEDVEGDGATGAEAAPVANDGSRA